MSIFIGAGTAVCTPFTSEGSFNPQAYEKLIRYQVENGADAIVACGTTGEASTLSFDEHVEVAAAAVAFTKKYAAEAGRKVPVVAGSGGNDTRHCVELGKALQKAGADALMYVAPYYNKTSQQGLVAHYSKLAASVDLPIVLYNIPARSVLNIQPKTMETLSKIENIAAVKEASGDFGQVAEIAERCGDALDLYAGNDDYIVPMMSLGGKGVISTVGNLMPQVVHDVVALYLDGDWEDSRKLQLGILGLVRAIFADVNPMPVKEALNMMGFHMGECRGPLTTISDDVRARLAQEMKARGL